MPSGEAVRRLAGDAAAARQPGAIVLVNANGLVKDFDPPGFDPDVATHLFVDPRIKDWLPNHQYPVDGPPFVHKVGDDSLAFRVADRSRGVSGAVEPTWPAGGTVEDGTITWNGQAYGPWIALTNFPLGSMVIGASNLFVQIVNTSDPGGATLPDWSTAPNYNDTVNDGALQWQNIGPVTTWAALTTYGYTLTAAFDNYYGPNVLPTTPAGYVFSFSGLTNPTPLTGSTEPAWHGTAGQGKYTLDADFLWVEDSSTDPQLQISGIAAPSGPRVLQIINTANDGSGEIVLKDEDSSSVEANRLDLSDSDVTLIPLSNGGAPTAAMLCYSESRWWLTRPFGIMPP